MPKYKQEVEGYLHALLGLAHMPHIRNGKQRGVHGWPYDTYFLTLSSTVIPTCTTLSNIRKLYVLVTECASVCLA
jgi:hypothetical protein